MFSSVMIIYFIFSSMLVTKLRISNISIDYFSLNTFYIFIATLEIEIERPYIFFKYMISYGF